MPVPANPNKVTGPEQKVIADWTRKDQQAFAMINLCISDDYLVYTYDARMACSVWQALLTIFQARGPLDIINICCDFFHTFAEEGTNIEEHICKLCSLQRQLHSLSDLVTDRDFCNCLLTSLPGSWSTFLTAINASLPSLSPDALIARVLEEDHTQKSSQGVDIALQAQNQQGKGG